MNKRDPFVLAGLGIVGLTAIAASFGTLMGLASWVGWHGWYMQILLPVCIDVLALVAGRVWLSASMAPEARQFARAVSFAAIGISIVGNAVGHIVTMHNASTVKIVLAIVVGSLPPAALAAVGHLATLATMQAEEAPVVGETPVVEEIVAESIESVENVVVPEPVVLPEVESVTQSESRRGGGRPAKKRAVALAFFITERAAGRMPTGAALARQAQADPTSGAKWIKEFLADEQVQQHTHKPQTSLSLVNA